MSTAGTARQDGPRTRRGPGQSAVHVSKEDRAIDVIGPRSRSAILRELARRGPLGTSELAEAVGITRSGARAHLDALEAQGVVIGDVPPEARVGRKVRWVVNPAAVEGLLTAIDAYLLGH